MILNCTDLKGLQALNLEPIEARLLLANVARAFKLVPEQLTGRDRAQIVARARYAAALALCARPAPGGRQRSSPGAGRVLGGRDHSTILHAVDRAFEIAGTGTEYAARIEAFLLDCPVVPVVSPTVVAALAMPPAGTVAHRRAVQINRVQVNKALAARRGRDKHLTADCPDSEADLRGAVRADLAFAEALRAARAEQQGGM